MSEPNERDHAVAQEVWPRGIGMVGDWPARRIAEYRVKIERECASEAAEASAKNAADYYEKGFAAGRERALEELAAEAREHPGHDGWIDSFISRAQAQSTVCDCGSRDCVNADGECFTCAFQSRAP